MLLLIFPVKRIKSVKWSSSENCLQNDFLSLSFAFRCEFILGEFLKDIKKNHSNVDFAAMVNNLVHHSQSEGLNFFLKNSFIDCESGLANRVVIFVWKHKVCYLTLSSFISLLSDFSNHLSCVLELRVGTHEFFFFNFCAVGITSSATIMLKLD